MLCTSTEVHTYMGVGISIRLYVYLSKFQKGKYGSPLLDSDTSAFGHESFAFLADCKGIVKQQTR